MRCQQLLQRQIGKNIAIIKKKGAVSQGAPGIANPASRIEKQRLMEELQSLPTVCWHHTEKFREFFRKMMRVERQCPDTGSHQAVEGKGHKRFVINRYQRFWENVGDWCKPCAESRSQNKSGG